MTRRAIFVVCMTSMSLCAQRTPEATTPLSSAQPPLVAELLAPLDAASLPAGATVFAKARTDWNEASCHIRQGAMVVGHVTDLKRRTKENRGSSVSVLFDQADCGGQLAPIQFTLYALIAVPNIDEGGPMLETANLFDPAANQLTGIHRTLDQSAPSNVTLNTMAARNNLAPIRLPASIKAGQVIGLRKVVLGVGEGPEGSSVLLSLKDNIRIEGGSQLILMRRPASSSGSAPTLSASTEPLHIMAKPVAPEHIIASVPKTELPPEEDETRICSAPCSLVPSLGDLKPSQAALTLSVHSLGYVPHDLRKMKAFGYESTLSYLDADNILFTYDPHNLRQRLPSGFGTESIRTIRAVLLDPVTLTIKKVVDWKIRGEGQYLWHTNSNGILIHLGHQLKLLNADLTVRREIPIPGHLNFVSMSPSGHLIALGTSHERHTHSMHKDLAEALHSDPEEDVDVQLLDENLSPRLTTRQSSSLPPPVLSEMGELRVNSAGKNRWHVHEFRWDRTDHTITTLTSACRPNLAAPLPGYIFALGCSQSPFQNWYRVMSMDGHVVLSGHSSSLDIEQCSTSTQGDFAIRVVRAHSAKLRNEAFSKQDLEQQEVSIYRPSDGKRLFFTADPNVSLVQQSFALSPTGNQLAVLSDVAISLYQVPR